MLAEVGFVEDEQAFGQGGRQGKNGRAWKARVGDFKQQVGCLDFAFGALDASGLDWICRVTDPCGIDESERDVMKVDDFLKGVAGGAG